MIAVDQLAFDFPVQPTMTDDNISGPPKEGSYVKDIILEGARWDLESMTLADAEPMMLFAPMPVILFKPITKKKFGDGYYQCPLYVYPNRNGSPTRPSFQIYVEVKSGIYDSGFWVKRGTAMLLATAE